MKKRICRSIMAILLAMCTLVSAAMPVEMARAAKKSPYYVEVNRLSNVVTVEEGAFYSVLSALSLVWAGILIISAMMEIHEYKLGKTIFFTIATIFAMLVMVFLLLLFFSMISQGIAYFVSIVREIMFRM